nr:hypothetical protein [uncultured Mediterranean phage uvMED]
MKGKSSFRRCKRQGVSARGKLLVRRWIRKGALSPMRLTLHLSVAVAWRCICRTSHRPRHIARAANMEPIAKDQRLALLH